MFDPNEIAPDGTPWAAKRAASEDARRNAEQMKKRADDLAAIRAAEERGESVVAAMYERMTPAERGAFLRAHQPAPASSEEREP